jgi:hypothetical protein
MCSEIGPPSAPEDWYADTPIYVGNEMPSEEVRDFAQGLEGYQDYWIDRDHHGWIGVGFAKDADVVAHQAALEAEFPGVGVVAVAMPWTADDLEEFRLRIEGDLPDDMQTAGVYEVQGFVEVWVGLLTPDRIAIAEQVIGDDPACLSGRDPATTPVPGPQPGGGEGWTLLTVAETWLGDRPIVIADAESLTKAWDSGSFPGEAPEVDFQNHIVLAFLVLHSSSCPVTRLDDIRVLGDLVQAVVVHLTDEMACTADGVSRTYLVSVERDNLPSPPFQIALNEDLGAQIEVAADLRVPGSVPDEGELTDVSYVPVRAPTATPTFVEGPGVPFSFTLEMACGIDYLGEINWVSWHRADATLPIPDEWDQATRDGLLDLEMMMTEGPEPTLTATAGGAEVLYLPGPDSGQPCG